MAADRASGVRAREPDNHGDFAGGGLAAVPKDGGSAGLAARRRLSAAAVQRKFF